MNKFWRWAQNKAPDSEDGSAARTLFLNGAIAEDDPWLDPSDVTPTTFKGELDSGTGPITLWINSPGGDVFAAAQIYNMLISYPGKVTVKIDGIAASAASVIAMAGDRVLVSPVSLLMVHDPQTIAMGDKAEMEKAIAMLDEVKESIINAYSTKTGLSHAKLATLMESETWMNAKKAVELHFADAVMTRNDLEGAGLEQKLAGEDADPEEKPDESEQTEQEEQEGDVEKSKEDDPKKDEKKASKETSSDRFAMNAGYLFSTRQLATAFLNKVEQQTAEDHMKAGEEEPDTSSVGVTDEAEKDATPEINRADGTRRVEDLMARLDLIHSLI